MKFCDRINFIFFINNKKCFSSGVNALLLRQDSVFTLPGNCFINCSFTSLCDFLDYYHDTIVKESLIKYFTPIYIVYQSQVFMINFFLKLFYIKKQESSSSFNEYLIVSILNFLTKPLIFNFDSPVSIFFRFLKI